MKTCFLRGAIITALLLIGNSAWTQQAATSDSSSPNTPAADKPPMQAQELASMVPQDSSQQKPVDISKQNAGSQYRYDKAGVNCSLYPARCRNESY